MTRLAAGISFVLLIATVGLVNTVLKHVEHAFAGQRILVEKSMSLAKDHLVSNFTASAYQAEGLTASLGEDLDSVLPVLKGGRSFKRTRGKLEPGTSRQFSDARQKIEFHWDKFRANYPECQSLTVIGADGQSIFTTSPFVMGGSLSAQWLKDFSESAADEGRSRYVVLDGEVRLLSIRPIFEDLAETPIAHLLVELAAPAIGKHGDFHISFVETEKLVSGAKLPDGVELNSLHSENAQVFGHEAVIASLPGVGLEVSRRPLLFEVVSADVVGLKFKVPNLDSAEIALWFS
ncbi:MAG: hypothetical protein VYA34_14550, partial [Myxococcota bacterium]|nr:hypothetical protein [Myxococcota bacterium]